MSKGHFLAEKVIQVTIDMNQEQPLRTELKPIFSSIGDNDPTATTRKKS